MAFKRIQQPQTATCVMTALAALGLLARAPAHGETYEVVISHGPVMDPESGLDDIRNVGISGRKIRAISSDLPAAASSVHDARKDGLVQPSWR